MGADNTFGETHFNPQSGGMGDGLIKSTWNIRECFKQLRFDKKHHLGLGDIRLTIAQQEEICELVERFYGCH